MHDAGASSSRYWSDYIVSTAHQRSPAADDAWRLLSEVTGDAGSGALPPPPPPAPASEVGLVTSTVAAIAFLLISALLLLYYREPIARRCCGVRAGSEATADDEHRYLSEPGKTDLLVVRSTEMLTGSSKI